MYRPIRSALFKRQVLSIAANYRDRAGRAVALDFVAQAEKAVSFITTSPRACPSYATLRGLEFRRWPVKRFPVSLYFRIDDDAAAVVLEAVYAHRMNTEARFLKDFPDQ